MPFYSPSLSLPLYAAYTFFHVLLRLRIISVILQQYEEQKNEKKTE